MKSVSLKSAQAEAEATMGRKCYPHGFEQRTIGPYTINIFYYSCNYDEIPTQYRADIYCDGKRTNGVAFG